MPYAKQTKQAILKHLRSQGRGRFVFPRQFDFDLPENIRKALRRLAQDKVLLKLGRGIFFYPKVFADGTPSYPTTDEIAQAIAKRDGVKIKETPYRALNSLGLSGQVPMRPVYMTSGGKKSIKINNLRIEFKPTAAKIFQTKGKISGSLVLALRALKPESLDEDKIAQISRLLKHEAPKNIAHDLALAPEWARKVINENRLA
jgi:hypothetical protein